MAKSINLTSILTITIFTLLFSFVTATNSPRFHRSISSTSLGLHKEKLTHIHFYNHDIGSGPKPTSVRVAGAHTANTSFTSFGSLFVTDVPLTVGPEPGSKLLGMAQGIYGCAAQDEVGLVMIMNLVFMGGKYNGSTLSLLGRNAVLSPVREMPIVGGSGAFRLARGYVQAKTHTFNPKTEDAVIEYNIYVFHY